MCNQTVCLVAAELERRGIPTVCLILLQDIAVKVGVPRALCVPFRHGFPLGHPHDPDGQIRVLEAALRLVEQPVDRPPVLENYPTRATTD